jgi:hypothetical protein
VFVGRSGAELYLSPRAEVLVGYDSNRLTAGTNEGSGFLAGSPKLEVTHFVSETIEVSGLLSYERKEYLRDGFSHTAASRARAGLWYAGGAWEGGFTLAIGDHDDGALPAEDATWYALSPAIILADLRGRRYSLSTSVTAYSYESRQSAEGGSISGTQWSLKPAVVWPLPPGASVWGEVWLEWFSSARDAEEYRGGGIAAGLDYLPPSRARAGVSAKFGVRDYADQSGDDTRGADGTASSVRAWYTLRLSPRVEFVLRGSAGTYWSNDGAAEYDRWQLLVGLSLADDFQLGSSRF